MNEGEEWVFDVAVEKEDAAQASSRVPFRLRETLDKRNTSVTRWSLLADRYPLTVATLL